MRKYFKLKIGLLLTITVALGAATYKIIQIKQLADFQLATERARLERQDRVNFEKIRLTPHHTDKVKIIQSPNQIRALVKFRETYFAATGGGLLELGTDGEPKRRFSVLDGLPESDLTALAVFQNKLFVGTKKSDFLTFDGENFTRFKLAGDKANFVTSFAVTGEKLLIGTFTHGLLEFDGENLYAIKAAERQISAINFLAKDATKLLVGTFDQGIFHRENGVWQNFTVAENLPSNRVVGAVKNGKSLLLATDFGVSEFTGDKLQKRFVMPALSSIVRFGDHIFLCKENGTVFRLTNNAPKAVFTPENLSDAHLNIVDKRLFLLSSNGIFVFTDSNFKPFFRQNSVLTDNFTAALAVDKNERIWAGNFRRGIDIFTSGGKFIKHLESEKLREINYLQEVNGEMSAATSHGIFRFKNNFSSVSLTKKDGLPADSITHFGGDNQKTAVIATNKGLIIFDNGKPKTLTAVQGLPSNSVTSVLHSGKTIYVGTLNGLAQITENKVVRVFNETNSALSPNWVTALAATQDGIFIGTYGGGVFELTASGALRSFAAETGKFSVNPNAIFADAERLFVGTLNGLQMLDLQTKSWHKPAKILPAETVLGITADAENYYFGTTGGIAQVKKSYFQNEESK